MYMLPSCLHKVLISTPITTYKFTEVAHIIILSTYTHSITYFQYIYTLPTYILTSRISKHSQHSYKHPTHLYKNKHITNTLTCKRAMNKKKMLAYFLNCSNKNFGRKVNKLYLAVLGKEHKDKA